MSEAKRTSWTPEEVTQLRQMAESGKSKLLMAAKFRRTIKAIEREARKHGIELKRTARVFTLRQVDDQRANIGRK